MTFRVINQLGLVNHQHEDHFDSLTSGAKKIQNPMGEKITIRKFKLALYYPNLITGK